MKIYIKRTRNANTAPKFIKHLKNCFEGYEHPEGDYFIINYGRAGNGAHLNGALVLNKIRQLDILRSQGILVPDVFHTRYPESLPRQLFPLLARKARHSKGRDIIFLKTKRSMYKRMRRVRNRDYFVKYIPKEAEYRVHVLGDLVVDTSKKVPSPKSVYQHPHVWCSLRGWTLENCDLSENYQEERLLDKLAIIGIKAVKALGYDFGAVDIGLGKDGKLYVFEVNSAPRLSRTRRRLYAKYFRTKEREYHAKNY